MSITAEIGGAPGTVRTRADVPAPAAYAVFDCETTGTVAAVDEIISFAAVRLDADGDESARSARLVRPGRPIPAGATAVHGIGDEDVADAPPFGEVAREVLELLDGAVFVAHNASFDLGMLRQAFQRVGIDYHPIGVACTLDAFRLLEPRAADHRLESVCARHAIALEHAHDALDDVLGTAGLLRVLLDRGLAPETVKLDHAAFLRLRARGDTRPVSEGQIRRVFGLARAAGLVLGGGGVDRVKVLALVERVSGTLDIDSLNREQVQDVYDALDHLIDVRPRAA
jgi:DNA polymerase III epsilon subunit family exonuclease